MKPKLKKKWLAALRGGKYKQANGILKHRNRFCCLGVLCDIQGIDWKEYKHDMMTSKLPEEYNSGLKDKQTAVLANMNDGTCGYEKFSFQQIADYIEESL